jgi:hypothetical protein
MNTAHKPIFETIGDVVTRKCTEAIEQYRQGADSVVVKAGAFSLTLTDRKDNANRETVRMSMEEMLGVVVAAHVNGAALASTAAAKVIAGLAGFALVDDDADVVGEDE